EENECHVRVAQRGGGDVAVCRVEVEQRHRHRDEVKERAPAAGEAVLRALFLLDVLLDLAQRRCVDIRGHGRSGKANAPRGRGVTLGVTRDAQLTLMPFSAKYLAAPGWYGSGEAPIFWFFRSKLAASLCTAISSSFLSKIVFTMLYATSSGMSSRAMIRFC